MTRQLDVRSRQSSDWHRDAPSYCTPEPEAIISAAKKQIDRPTHWPAFATSERPKGLGARVSLPCCCSGSLELAHFRGHLHNRTGVNSLVALAAAVRSALQGSCATRTRWKYPTPVDRLRQTYRTVDLWDATVAHELDIVRAVDECFRTKNARTENILWARPPTAARKQGRC